MARFDDRRSRVSVCAAAAAMALVLAACPFKTHVIPPREPSPPGGQPARVVLIIIDGLRRDVFHDHLAGLDRLSASDSGLRLLEDEGFELARSEHAETVAPSYTIGAMASLATGLYPDRHGIVGNNFHELGRAGPPARYDFDKPFHAAQIYYEAAASVLQASDDPRHLPLLASLVARTQAPPRVPATVYELLRGQRTSAVVLHHYGAGATWVVPTLETAISLGIGMSDSGALDDFDEAAAREAAKLLGAASPPDLTTIYFAGVDHRSHHQAGFVEQRRDLTLQQIQAEYLRVLDRHLARVLRAYRKAHPDLFAQTAFLLTADHGHLSRTNGVALSDGGAVKAAIEERRIDAGLLFRWLANAAPDAALAGGRSCRELIAQSGDAANGEPAFLFSADGGMAHLYVNRTGAATLRRDRERLGCLEKAARALLARDDADTGSGAVVGATFLEPGALGRTLRAGKVEALLRDAFARKLGKAAERRKAKMRLIGSHVDASGGTSRSGEVIAFVTQAERWLFVGAGDSPTFSDHGGLDDELMQVPFLLASKRLAPGAGEAIAKAEGLETTDVAPTILSILQVEPPPWAKLRAPIVSWTTVAGQPALAFREGRDNAIPEPEQQGVYSFSEVVGGKVRFGVGQGVSAPAPESIDLKAGDEVFHWRKGTWLGGAASHCTADGHEWSCDFDFGEASAVKLVAARRCPPLTTSPGAGARCDLPFILLPFVRDGAAPAWKEEPPSVRCVDDEKIRLVPNARDDFSVARVLVRVADPRDVQDRYSRPHLQVADASPPEAQLQPTADCYDPSKVFEKPCAVAPPPPPGDGVLSVSLPHDQIDLYLRARRAVGPKNAGAGRVVWDLAERLLGAGPPRDFILTITVCDFAEHCIEQPLLTDVQYDRLRAQGCGRR